MIFTDNEIDTLLHALMLMCGTDGEDFHRANNLHTKLLMHREELAGRDPGTRIVIGSLGESCEKSDT